LQEGEERVSVRNDLRQRPVMELPVLPQDLNEPLIEHGRHTLSLVMATQENLE
jgi:hypothetical protein